MTQNGTNGKHARRKKELPARVGAAVAVMRMGYSDYSEIASAVGLSEDEVRRIDMAEDRRIRELASRGIPNGKRYTLVQSIRCPKCREKITLVPCVVCDSREALAEEKSSA